MSRASQIAKRSERQRRKVERDRELVRATSKALEQVSSELQAPLRSLASVKPAARVVGKAIPQSSKGRKQLTVALRNIWITGYLSGYILSAKILGYKVPDEKFAEEEFLVAKAMIKQAKSLQVMTADQFRQLSKHAKEEAFTAANQTLETCTNARDLAVVSSVEGDTVQSIIKQLEPEWLAPPGEGATGRAFTRVHIENVVRTNTLRAYNHGWSDVAFQPGLEEKLPAAEFVAVADDRTTEICMSLDGKLLAREAVGDYTPPLHFMCRSLLVWLNRGQTGSRNISSLKSLRGMSTQPAEGFGSYTPVTIAK